MPAPPRNLLTQWSRLFVESLYDGGVRHAVVSPGSRSTPLIAALQDSGRIQIDVVVDERSAAFVALGHAKVSGVPSICVCTSGSAGAHYFPAVIEADQSGTPLILITADRPPELHENRAPQTIDQTRLFGSKVRRFIDLGSPELPIEALRGLRRKALQAVAATFHPQAGPVHINFRARKPLEPSAQVAPEAVLLKQQVDGLLEHTCRFERPRLEPTGEAVALLIEAAREAKRPALVLGPMAPYAGCDEQLLTEFAAQTGWPVLCEVTSQSRFAARAHGLTLCDGFDLVCRALAAAPPSSASLSAQAELLPDLVLQLGDPPVSGAWASLLGRLPKLSRVVASATDWPDPLNNATAVVATEPNALLHRLIGCVPPATMEWRSACLGANQKAWRAVEAERARVATDFSEGMAVAALSDALEDGDLLLLGNSLPVRLAETFLRCSAKAVPVVSQRGSSGIDGWISLAAGAASAHALTRKLPHARTLALIGDIAFLHDVGGLLALAAQAPDLTLVVLNNGGGRIFEQLPVSGTRSLEAWTTPHRLELHRLARDYGIRAFRSNSAASLDAALKISRKPGPVLIEVVVSPHGASETYERIVGHLQADLTGTLSSAPPQDGPS